MIRVKSQAETFALHLAAGPPIVWTDEDKAYMERLKKELLRREQAGEIGPLDASNPQSMTDALQTQIDLRKQEGAPHGRPS